LGQEDGPLAEHERLNYLNEHVSYELIMLNYTFMRLMTLNSSTAKPSVNAPE